MTNSRARDVAQRAGVSVGTVSNVLNRPETVSKPIADRVRSAILELGYSPNEAARQLRAGKSNSVAYLVRDVRNPFFTDVALGADRRAQAAGLALTLANSDEAEERQSTYLDLFEKQRVRSILITPVGDVRERLEALRDRGVSVVLIDTHVEGFSSVTVDNALGGRMAVDHLLSIGRSKVAFVGSSRFSPQVADRLDGARQALLGAQRSARLETIEIADHDVRSGAIIGDQLLAREAVDRPDAVFAANDLIAIGILHSLSASRRVRVPEDIAIIGYDDIEFARSTPVPLASVAQPSDLMGGAAMQIAIEEAADPSRDISRVTLRPKLMTRASTVG